MAILPWIGAHRRWDAHWRCWVCASESENSFVECPAQRPKRRENQRLSDDRYRTQYGGRVGKPCLAARSYGTTYFLPDRWRGPRHWLALRRTRSTPASGHFFLRNVRVTGLWKRRHAQLVPISLGVRTRCAAA